MLLLTLAGACAQPQPTAPAPRLFGPGDSVALVQLMRLEDTRTFDVPTLSQIAGSRNPVVRARSMLAAGRIGNHAATSLLIAGLNDVAESVRAHAAFALGELSDTSAAVVDALGALSRKHGEAGAEALHALGKLATPRARPFVEDVLLSRQTGPELLEALLAIWHFPRTPATSTLVRPLTQSPNVEVRWRAVYALTRGGPDPSNVPAFQQWLRDADPLVRSLAARGLRAPTADSIRMRAPAAASLVAALRDSDAHVRINAVSVLGGYRDSTYTTAAAPLLLDTDLNVRMAAAQALGLLKGGAAAAALEPRIRDTSERTAIRGVALASLLSVDVARGTVLATELARSNDPLVRMYVARALANGRSLVALGMARTLAADADYHVAAPAVAAIAAMAGDTLTGARAFFVETLAAPNPYVRAEALAGLEKLAAPGDEAIAFEAFQRALQDSVEDAAIAALNVVAKLAKNRPAVQRAFSTRFPLERMRIPSVQRAAVEKLGVTGACCAPESRPADYARVVGRLLLPALRGDSLPRVRVNTAAGTFVIELLPADAPLTVDNFLSLVRRNYFDGSRWHRVVPNFVLQDGDPTGTGNGGPGYAIRDEINRDRYQRGAVGMALSGPDTGGSQFFVTHSPQPHLDGGYTIFGKVVSGMEVADRVIQDDPITSIEIVR